MAARITPKLERLAVYEAPEPIAPGVSVPAFVGFGEVSIPDGDAGANASLKLMAKIIDAYKSNPVVYSWSRQVVADLPQKAYYQEARTLADWVRDRIAYRRDPVGQDSFQVPPRTLEFASGDCDDKTMLLGAGLMSIGHPIRLVALKAPGADLYGHVFLETLVGKRWYAADATEPQPFGFYPGPGYRMVIYA